MPLPVNKKFILSLNKERTHSVDGLEAALPHASEVECIGKGKARAPYLFSCKISIATPVTKPKDRQFVFHAKALYDHTLGSVIAEMEALLGAASKIQTV